jgi:hypothetical protein
VPNISRLGRMFVLKKAVPAIREKYLAPSRGHFRFRALKDDYEK